MAECRELEKKYYSCFPFLLQMAILYLNHATLSDAPLHIYEHCIELTQRIRSLSEDVNDAKEALTLEASCYLLLVNMLLYTQGVGECRTTASPKECIDICMKDFARATNSDTLMFMRFVSSLA